MTFFLGCHLLQRSAVKQSNTACVSRSYSRSQQPLCRLTAALCRAQGSVSSGAKTGSAIWVGARCNVTVTDSELTDNEEYGVEANNSRALVTVESCKISDNRKGTADEWAGGKVSLDEGSAAAA